MNDWSTLKKLIWTYIVKVGGGIARTVSGPIVHITNALARAVKSLTVAVEPVQSGSGDPSPTNVRPISGWTGAKVTRTGKNLLSLSTVKLGGTNPRTKSETIGTIPPGTYRFSAVKSGTVTENFGIQFLGSNNEVVGQVSTVLQNVTLTAPAVKAYAYMASGDYSDGKTLVLSNIQLELGSTATTYEPYQGDTYDITFPDEAGTVYGGMLDVTNGKMVVDRALWTRNTATMNNSNDYPGWQNSGIRALIGSGYNLRFEHQTMNIGTEYSVNTVNDYDILFLRKQTYGKTQDEWKALAIDVQIVAELATPIEITLTPTQIELLQGENTLWADTGDVTVTYYTSA